MESYVLSVIKRGNNFVCEIKRKEHMSKKKILVLTVRYCGMSICDTCMCAAASETWKDVRFVSPRQHTGLDAVQVASVTSNAELNGCWFRKKSSEKEIHFDGHLYEKYNANDWDNHIVFDVLRFFHSDRV